MVTQQGRSMLRLYSQRLQISTGQRYSSSAVGVFCVVLCCVVLSCSGATLSLPPPHCLSVKRHT